MLVLTRLAAAGAGAGAGACFGGANRLGDGAMIDTSESESESCSTRASRSSPIVAHQHQQQH